MGNLDQMLLLGMMITVILLGLACVVLFHFIPSRLATNQQRSIKHFINFFTFAACAFIVFLFMGELLTEGLSVIINSVLYVAAIQYLRHGLAVRHNPQTPSISKQPQFIGNLVFVAVSQYVFIKFFNDPALIGNIFLNGNIILLCLLCLPFVKQNRNGERVVRYSIYFSVLLIFALTLSQHHTDLRPYYMLFVMSIQAILFIVWLGALFGLLLSDNIEEHFENSMTDAMTGLNNRRYFMLKSGKRINQTIQLLSTDKTDHSSSATIIICDIDHFKKINDTYGHSEGDKVICHVANILKKITRDGDILARIGGEEFALFRVNSTPDDALTTAKELRTLTHNQPFDNIHCTVSTGIATLSIDTDTNKDALLKELLIRADHALYQAKHDGRDTISVIPEETLITVR